MVRHGKTVTLTLTLVGEIAQALPAFMIDRVRSLLLVTGVMGGLTDEQDFISGLKLGLQQPSWKSCFC